MRNHRLALRSSLWVSLGILELVALAALAQGREGASPLPPSFQRGACVEGGPQLEAENLQELAELGVTAISLNPFGWMQAPDQPLVRTATQRKSNPSARFWGEGDEGLAQYARLAHEHGFQVMLRPHLWLGSNSDRKGRSGLWLGDVGFDSAEDWHTFFQSYRELCLHYARLAEDARIEWYSVGAELTRTTLEHPDEWRALIAEVRGVYHGKLIYSANWWAEAEGIQFWDMLDAIGVQAYYPVATSPEDTEDQMAEAWRPHLQKLGALSQRFGKPVIFTEIGYKCSADAAINPWKWDGSGDPRPDVQARAYRAAFRALAEAPWVQGMYWWKYHVVPRHAQPSANDYTWQGTEAADVLRKAFGRLAHPGR